MATAAACLSITPSRVRISLPKLSAKRGNIEVQTGINKLSRLAVDDIACSPYILRTLDSEKLIDHHLALLVQQVLGHVLGVWDDARGGDVQIHGHLLAAGEGEGCLAGAVGLRVCDLGVFHYFDLELFELVLREGYYVGWEAEEDLGAACDLIFC